MDKNHTDRREGKRMKGLKGIFPDGQVMETSSIHPLLALEPFVGLQPLFKFHNPIHSW
jgi:hypothetical protein